MAAHAAAEEEENDLPKSTRRQRFAELSRNPEHLIPQNDKLLIFRALTGIDSVPALTSGGHLLRTAPNVGIYTRIVTSETKARRGYVLFHYCINLCLGIQIIVAAAVTALGAASGPHSAVTAFGAINTIMAGTLTYLRGAGLPDRLKTHQNKWKHIREYIEQREREFCMVGCTLDVQEEIFIVESMYQSLKSEMEATKTSGEGRAQQADDFRIRRPPVTTSQQQSDDRATTTPVRRTDALAPQQPEGSTSTITVPPSALEKN